MLVILIGNIGTGKSTFAKNISKGREVIDYDNLGEKHGQNFNVYNEILKLLKKGKTVIVDGVNIEKRKRKDLIYFARINNAKSVAIDFGKGNEKSLHNRISQPRNIPIEVWKREHYHNIKIYEKPCKSEGFDRVIRCKNYYE